MIHSSAASRTGGWIDKRAGCPWVRAGVDGRGARAPSSPAAKPTSAARLMDEKLLRVAAGARHTGQVSSTTTTSADSQRPLGRPARAAHPRWLPGARHHPPVRQSAAGRDTGARGRTGDPRVTLGHLPRSAVRARRGARLVSGHRTSSAIGNEIVGRG